MNLKAITVICAAVFSLAAWSCPQLEGTYRCRVNGKVTDTIITQDLRNGVWTFVVTNDATTLDVVADGKNYNVSDLGEIRNASYRASCNSQQLTINASGDVYSGTRFIGKGTSVMDFSKQRNSDNLIARTTVSMGGFRLPTETVNCPRL